MYLSRLSLSDTQHKQLRRQWIAFRLCPLVFFGRDAPGELGFPTVLLRNRLRLDEPQRAREMRIKWEFW